jgi:hypothetical protein
LQKFIAVNFRGVQNVHQLISRAKTSSSDEKRAVEKSTGQSNVMMTTKGGGQPAAASQSVSQQSHVHHIT